MPLHPVIQFRESPQDATEPDHPVLVVQIHTAPEHEPREV